MIQLLSASGGYGNSFVRKGCEVICANTIPAYSVAVFSGVAVIAEIKQMKSAVLIEGDNVRQGAVLFGRFVENVVGQTVSPRGILI